MEILENLGRRVKEKRGAQGIRAAAKEIGLSHATLSRVERGFLPDLENYKKICKWLGLDLEVQSQPKKKSQAAGVAQVHFRKKPTSSPDTAQALAELILAAQRALLSEGRQDT
ncbi:transcriptional regulator with XRE-family HTH domain [Bradyrhizobium sp. F1.4.3]|uniref:helix-turn-helix domain-containing protein n=1 Tax=Bradyrhizobium sp. F1.4.3 TaxID=3156356 RepID=UPI0033968E0B